MTLDGRMSIGALPMPLQWLREPQSWSAPDGASLRIAAGPHTDWFTDPQQLAEPKLNAPALVGSASGDFLLSARLTVDFAKTYDAGVLVVYASDSVWAKLCFEYSPQREPMVVSVVTKGVSDDCNSFVIDDASVWLRIARIGTAFAFHASTEGSRWSFIRQFALESSAEPLVGFAAQSPTGDGCAVVFDRIAYETTRLGDLRSGV